MREGGWICRRSMTSTRSRELSRSGARCRANAAVTVGRGLVLAEVVLGEYEPGDRRRNSKLCDTSS